MPDDELPVYVSTATKEERQNKRVCFMEQLKQLNRCDKFPCVKLPCAGCKKRVTMYKMYRCLYCGVWYCKECAEHHFGMRVPTWQEDNANEQ